MDEKTDILAGLQHKANPFRTPEGYFDSLEGRLAARLSDEENATSLKPAGRVWRILKPALTLAATFAIIFGMGYGVLSLTHTIDRENGTTPVAGYASAEEEMIRPASIINYYQSDVQDTEEEEVGEETLVDYLASELSFADLAEIYAQLY